MSQRGIGSSVRIMGAGAAAAAAAYATVAGVTWYRYGRTPASRADERDELLDSFMPRYEVLERHHREVAAPAALTFAAACEQDLLHLPLIRLIFKTREVVLRSLASRKAARASVTLMPLVVRFIMPPRPSYQSRASCGYQYVVLLCHGE